MFQLFACLLPGSAQECETATDDFSVFSASSESFIQIQPTSECSHTLVVSLQFTAMNGAKQLQQCRYFCFTSRAGPSCHVRCSGLHLPVASGLSCQIGCESHRPHPVTLAQHRCNHPTPRLHPHPPSNGHARTDSSRARRISWRSVILDTSGSGSAGSGFFGGDESAHPVFAHAQVLTFAGKYAHSPRARAYTHTHTHTHTQHTHTHTVAADDVRMTPFSI